MSMLCHGNSTPNWVCRCRSGLRSVLSPRIHIFAGENVCIQAMTPMHSGRGVRLGQDSGDRIGVGDDGQPAHLDRDLGAAVESLGDLTGLIGDLVEDVLPVHGLAARDQPHLAGDESGRDHRWFSWRVSACGPAWPYTFWYRSNSAATSAASIGGRRTELTADVDGAGHVLDHHRGLDGVAGGAADGERSVVAHQHRAEICCPATPRRCRGRSSRHR